MNRIILFLAAALLSSAASARCEHSEMHRHNFEADAFQGIDLAALAGSLDVIGTDSDRIVFEGRACTDRDQWLDHIRLDIDDGGNVLSLTVSIPYDDRDFDARYAHMDVVLELPRDLAIAIRDSSGDILVRDAAVTSIDDSSGNIRVENGRHTLMVEDSSGDIDLRGIDGDVTVRDSSGSISIRRVTGDVTIPSDSAGDIEIDEVEGTVVVARDSSGDIEIEGVGQRVEVGSDGSGDIEIRDVAAGVRIESDGSGRVQIDDVSGDFELLAKGAGDVRVRGVEGNVSTPR